MPWGRLDDGVNDNSKFTALSDSAFRLWVCGLVFCQKNLTDGFIPEDEILHFRLKAKSRASLIAELLAPQPTIGKGPFWHEVAGGYQMHDYLHWNDPRDKVLATRKANDQRKQRFFRRRSGNATQNGTGNADQNADQNAFQNAFLDTSFDAARTRPERGTTYHVPRTYEKQERAAALLHPVETVENRVIQFARRQRSRETSSGKPSLRVITALARTVMTNYPTIVDDGDLLENVKVACAAANLLYDSTSVGLAIDAARAQLRKRKDIPA